MLNANASGGLDPSNPRAYANAQYAQGQVQGGNTAFSLAGNMPGLHSLQGNYGVQGGIPGGRPGLGGIPTSGSQQPQQQPQQQQVGAPQGRFTGGLNPGMQQMQQYGQVPGRGGLPLGMNGMNSIGGPGGARSGVGNSVGVNPGLAGAGRPGLDRGSSGGMMGMGGGGVGGSGGGLLGVRTGSGQQGGVSLASLNGPRLGNVPVNHLAGQLGNLGLQNSPARPGSGLGMSMQGMGAVGPASAYNPSGDLLAMMNKAGVSSVGGMGMGGGSKDGGLSTLGGGMNAVMGGASEQDQPAFDASDFPSLGGQAHTEPFSMQTEDFPALPSSATSSFGGQRMGDDVPGMGGNFQHNGGPTTSAGYEQMLWNQQQQQQMQAGGQGNAKGSMQAMMSASGKNMGSTPDRFGLLGLLSVIRMTDPDLTTLALGTDLTTLGLNLNSPDNLYKTFASPWADAPVPPEPEFTVPSCYMHNPPRLQPGYFSKFQLETLFYIFYSMPGDEAQLYAADELAIRGWWFHKDHKLWLARVPNAEPVMKTDRFERASYFVFDTSLWDCVRRDNFGLHYDAVERAPNLMRPGPQPGGGGPAGRQPPPPAPK